MAKANKVNPLLMSVLAWAGPLYIRLVRATTREEILGEDNVADMRARDGGYIVAFWHSRILMMIPMRRIVNGPFWFMISEHRDGDIITRIAEPFRISAARGSTANPRKQEKKKGGSLALRTLLRALGKGEAVGLTPDGPRGPRQRCQMGVVQLARLAGVPIYPVAYASARARVFSSWDRFHLPLPFSRGCYVFGEPIEIGRGGEAEMEADRLRLERALNTVTARADEAMGHRPVEPADEPATVVAPGHAADMS